MMKAKQQDLKQQEFRMAWQRAWMAIFLDKTGAIRFARVFFKEAKLNSLRKVLDKFWEERLSPSETVFAWAVSGAPISEIKWKVEEMRIQVTTEGLKELMSEKRGGSTPKRGKGQSARVDPGDGTENGQETKVKDKGKDTIDFASSSVPTSSTSTSSISSSLSSGDLGIKEDKKEEKKENEDLFAMDWSRNTLEDVDLRGEIRKILGEVQGSVELDQLKVSYLAGLFPTQIALAQPMTAEERKEFFRSYLKIGKIIPPALKQDFSKLSTKLTRWEKHEIDTLYRMQLRTRDKLKMVLSHLYETVDTEAIVTEQESEFGDWHRLFIALVDDLVWLVKEQQAIILQPHHLEAVATGRVDSIIPLEWKTQLREVTEFQRLFRTESRGGFGNRRGRGRFRARGTYPGRGRSFGFGNNNYSRGNFATMEGRNEHSRGVSSRGRGSFRGRDTQS
jgi:hypothetical protein